MQGVSSRCDELQTERPSDSRKARAAEAWGRAWLYRPQDSRVLLLEVLRQDLFSRGARMERGGQRRPWVELTTTTKRRHLWLPECAKIHILGPSSELVQSFYLR